MQKKQEAVASKEIETSAGGGAVIVKATGDKVIKEIIIKKDVVVKTMILTYNGKG